MDDVGTFHRVARVYDLAMPGADVETLGRALAYAEREVECVVDLAGGTGRGLRAVESIDAIDGTPLQLTGIVVDAARGMVGRADDHGHAAVVGDATGLPLRTDSADAILVVDALHHLPDRRATLREVRRVLAPGGVLVIQEFDPTTLPGRAIAAGERLLGFDSRFEPPGALGERLERAGFQYSVVDPGFSYVVVAVAR